MSYLVKKEVLVTPVEGQRIIRNCSKCGGKSIYINTENFRVNANGNAVDVWLIYQCEKCKTTYNLSVYERVRPKSIPRQEYERYMSNDRELAWKVSYTPSILKRNHVEIDTSSMNYKSSTRNVVLGTKSPDSGKGMGINVNNEQHMGEIQIKNPYQLRIRIDRILAEVLGVSRTEVKRYYENETLIQLFLNEESQNKLLATINKACVYNQINFQYREHR